MKVVILAGGFGMRLSEETKTIPKPMVPIGGNPILWHIMKIYAQYGFTEFIVCLGYKGAHIKSYFAHYFLQASDVTIDLSNSEVHYHKSASEPWKVTLVDTGLNTQTGGRIKRIKDFVGDETFLLTYGDGVGDVDIEKLVAFHKQHGGLATLTAAQPEGRFGALSLDGSKVVEFMEKRDNEMWVNAGFFVLEPGVFDYIADDSTPWEKEPLQKLSEEGQLHAYQHHGFWKPMDKLYDKRQLEEIWSAGAPWKVWDD